MYSDADWERAVSFFRRHYESYSFLDDMSFMMRMEERLLKFRSSVPYAEWTDLDREKMVFLPIIQFFLQ